MRPYLLALALSLSLVHCAPTGSGANATHSAWVGKTESELTSRLGEPTKRYLSQERAGALLLTFPESAFQIEQGRVVAHSREPRPEERRLEIWRQQLGSAHLERRSDGFFEVRFKKHGITLLYSQSTDAVTRVVMYEP